MIEKDKMRELLRDALNNLPAVHKAHVVEPCLEEVAQVSFKVGQEAGQNERIEQATIEQAMMYIIAARRRVLAAYEVRRQSQPGEDKVWRDGYDSATQDLIDYLQALMK